MGEISAGGIEDAGLVACGGLALLIDGGEAAQGNAEGKAQMIRGGLGVEFFCVVRQWGAFWAVDALLGPVLRVAPGRWTWPMELQGALFA